MDTLTHIVLGGCIGEVIAGKQLGKKAIFLGAFANSIPDLDFIASFWLPITGDLLAHRGFTHSFAFIVLAAPLLAYLSRYLFRKASLPWKKWLLFWGIQIFVHDFIDAFNAYGTGWFEPFSHYRVSFNAIFVADPFFSIWPALAFIVLLLLRKTNPSRLKWAQAGLWLCSIYLLISIAFKLAINIAVKDSLQNRHIACKRYFSTPTPLNNLLWYIVAENDSGYYIGYRSVLDKKAEIDFHYDYRDDSLLAPYRSTDDLQRLLRFSNGYYVAGKWHDTLVFNDMRFGEITGWADAHPRFSFYYFLQYPDNNKLVVQRGRFAGWNKQSFRQFLQRMAGN